AVALPLSYTRTRSTLLTQDPKARLANLRRPTGFDDQAASASKPSCRLASPSAEAAMAGGGGRTRTYEGVSQRIFSPPPDIDITSEFTPMLHLCRVKRTAPLKRQPIPRCRYHAGTDAHRYPGS